VEDEMKSLAEMMAWQMVWILGELLLDSRRQFKLDNKTYVEVTLPNKYDWWQDFEDSEPQTSQIKHPSNNVRPPSKQTGPETAISLLLGRTMSWKGFWDCILRIKQSLHRVFVQAMRLDFLLVSLYRRVRYVLIVEGMIEHGKIVVDIGIHWGCDKSLFHVQIAQEGSRPWRFERLLRAFGGGVRRRALSLSPLRSRSRPSLLFFVLRDSLSFRKFLPLVDFFGNLLHEVVNNRSSGDENSGIGNYTARFGMSGFDSGMQELEGWGVVERMALWWDGSVASAEKRNRMDDLESLRVNDLVRRVRRNGMDLGGVMMKVLLNTLLLDGFGE